MPLALALGALLCYYLLVRGVQMARAQPGYSTDSDAELAQMDLPSERKSLIAGLYRVLGRWSGPTISGLLGERWRLEVGKLLAAAGQPRGLNVAGFAELQGAYATLAVLGTLLMILRGSGVIGYAVGAVLLFYRRSGCTARLSAGSGRSSRNCRTSSTSWPSR